MKHGTTALAVVLALAASLALGACDEQAAPPSALARVTDDGPVLLVEETALASIFADQAVPAQPGARPGAPVVGHTFDSYEIEVEGEFAYAIARGTTDDGSCFIAAKQIDRDGDRIGLLGRDGMLKHVPGGSGHSCTGQAGCQSCSFTKNSAGEITGCNCNTQAAGGTGWCSHTITSG